jgi:TolA-binding protein
VRRLRPIGFTWKQGGMRDIGFGAEDVEKIDPLLVTYNQQGQVEGVKYDRINVVLVNAMKEQQQQINAQQKQIRDLQVELKRRPELNQQLQQQQAQINSLRKLVCAVNPTPELCHK